MKLLSPRTILFALASFLAMTHQVDAYSVAATPNLSLKTSGIVHDVLVEPDGHIILAGYFSEAGGLPRRNLARLNPDGSIDATWSFNTNNEVRSVARSSTGAIYVVGKFSEIAGVARPGVARIAVGPGGFMLDSWVPNAVTSADDVEVGAEGDVMLLTRGRVRRFPGGSDVPVPDWGGVPVLWLQAWDIAISADGQYVATCAYDGEVAKFTRAGVMLWKKNWFGSCNEIEFAPDGAVFAARSLFNEVDATPSLQIISRITAAGEYDPAWENPLEPAVDAFAILPSGEVWIGTSEARDLDYEAGAHHLARHGEVFRFQPNGVAVAGTIPVADSNIETLNLLPDGDVLVGGRFRVFDHERRDSVARIDPGTLELQPALSSLERLATTVYATKRLRDGSYLVSGDFTSIGGVPRRFLARLSRDFEVLAESWPLDTTIGDLLQDESGHCYLSGLYPPMPMVSPSTLLRLENCGAVDANWRPTVSDKVSALALGEAGDYAIYAASCIDWYGRTADGCKVERFSLSAAQDVPSTWSATTSGEIESLLPESGSLFVGGQYHLINGQARAGLARLNIAQSGLLDPLWVAQRTPLKVLSLASNRDGEIIVSGEADLDEGRPALIRLSTDTGLENQAWQPWQAIYTFSGIRPTAFSPDGQLYVSGRGVGITRTVASGATSGFSPDLIVGYTRYVGGLISLGGGELLASGSFYTIGGETRYGLARLLDVSPTMFADSFD